MSVAIRATGLGKQYRIGTAKDRHDTIGAVLMHSLSAPLRNLRTMREMSSRKVSTGANAFWALRDVSFDVHEGEVLGVIGRNGAGKSTLLKVLSRITEPTEGRAEVRGRIGSLLEVGTGFHPELSGRENIYLNGSILGMDRGYIDQQFDAIVDFAGVERFIDTPVKRYSSGMYLRLAFAVAAHLEPDILIVDEVLAVGDAQFQKKCIGKIGEVTRHGRTVLFVSHNMAAITQLCNRAILLKSGSLVMDGPARDVIQGYLAAGAEEVNTRTWPGADAPGDHTARLRSVTVKQLGTAVSRVDMQVPIEIEIEYDVLESFKEFNVAVHLHDEGGDTVLHTTHSLSERELTQVEPGRYRTVCRLPAGALNAGTYWITLGGEEMFRRSIWIVEHALHFEVEITSPRMARYPAGTYKGIIGPLLPAWERHTLALFDEPSLEATAR